MKYDEVADELYGVPPDEFVAIRNTRAKEARAAGDKELAGQVTKLAKPNQVAWLANQLVRAHRDEIQPLLDLGADLRDASGGLSPDQLREFTRQQRRLVAALVSQARQIAASAGKRVSDDTATGLQATLQAALADPDAAREMLAGCLVEGMRHIGFGPSAAPAQRHLHAVPAPPNVRRRRSGASERHSAAHDEDAEHDERRREVERAKQALTNAQAAARETAQMRDDAKGELDRATAHRDSIERTIDRLRDELDSAQAEHRKASRDERRLQATFEHTDALAADAVRRLQRAVDACRRLAQEG